MNTIVERSSKKADPRVRQAFMVSQSKYTNTNGSGIGHYYTQGTFDCHSKSVSLLDSSNTPLAALACIPIHWYLVHFDLFEKFE